MSDTQITAPTTLALTLEDAKAQLNLSSTADDALITNHIRAATEMLETRCGRAFVTQTRALRMRTFHDPRYASGRSIVLPRSPLKSISSISYVATDGTTTTLPSSDYRVSAGDQPGHVGEEHGASWPATRNVAGDVVVTYVAGHSTVSSGVPHAVKQAIRMVVGHWYRNREAVLVGTISKEMELGIDALLEGERVERYA